MKVKAKHKYPVSPDVVYKAFTDPEFYVDKFEGCGARNVEVEKSSKKGKKFSISISREVPAQAPALLKKFIGDWNTLEQSESWKADGDEFVNELKIKSPGVPVRIEGSMNLRPQGKGSINEVELDVTCSIPLVGRALAEFIGSDAERTLEAEYKFIKGYLKNA